MWPRVCVGARCEYTDSSFRGWVRLVRMAPQNVRRCGQKGGGNVQKGDQQTRLKNTMGPSKPVGSCKSYISYVFPGSQISNSKSSNISRLFEKRSPTPQIGLSQSYHLMSLGVI